MLKPTNERLLREWIILALEAVTLAEDDINEFSACGSGAIVGYSLPLGANPDDYGRKLNKPKKRKNKRNTK